MNSVSIFVKNMNLFSSKCLKSSVVNLLRTAFPVVFVLLTVYLAFFDFDVLNFSL